jgi:MFS family permease
VTLPLAITSYEFSLFLHITAVMVGFGATFAESVMFPVAMRLSPRHLPYVHRLQLVINQFFALPALGVVIATGFYQVSEGNWELGDFWLSATLAIVIAIAIINLVFFIPQDRKLGPMIERELAAAGDGEFVPSEEYQQAAMREGVLGSVTGLLLVMAVLLMVDKPGVT